MAFAPEWQPKQAGKCWHVAALEVDTVCLPDVNGQGTAAAHAVLSTYSTTLATLPLPPRL
jgi:hypothetical protein